MKLKLSKIFLRLPRLGAVLICAVLLSLSCTKDQFNGEQFAPSDENISLLEIDDFELEMNVIKVEDLKQTSNRNPILIGEYIDPVFGSVQSSVYTQFDKPSNIAKPWDIQPTDSVKLVLYFASYDYGKLVSGANVDKDEQTYKVYELKESVVLDSSRTVSDNLELGTLYTTHVAKPEFSTEKGLTLTIPFPTSDLADRLLSGANENNYASSSTFKKFFPGLFITSESTDGIVGSGNVIGFDFNSGSSKIEVYYTADSTAKKLEYKITSQESRALNIELDYANSNVPNSFGQTVLGENEGYIQGLGGIRLEVEIKNLEKIIQADDPIILNQAILSLPVESGSTDEFAPSAELILVDIEEDGTARLVPDLLLEGRDHFDGRFQTDNQRYDFNITRYIQSFIDDLLVGKKVAPKMAIEILGPYILANRIIVNGPENSENPTKLTIKYTQ